jgi:hypothetical protein
MSVSSKFTEPPFGKRGGRLTPDVGGEDFVKYSIHRKLLETVREGFSRPVIYRVVYGGVGQGKTWTLGWLWRESQTDPKALVIGIPRLESRKAPERALVEALLRGVLQHYPTLFEKASVSKKASENVKVIASYLEDSDGRLALIGQSSTARPPRISDLPAISMGSLEDLERIILAILEAAKIVGFDRVLVLIDELESPFILHSKKAIQIFGDFLRNLYDVLEEDAPQFAHVQIVFAGTSTIYEFFKPQSVHQLAQQSGIIGAFIRRTEDIFVLTPPDENEILEIAAERIEQHRRQAGKRFIPYEEAAILAAWTNAARNMGHFVKLLQEMYELADSEGAAKITAEHCERVSAKYADAET